MKRDALFSVTKAMGNATDALLSLYATFISASDSSNPDSFLQSKIDKGKASAAATAAFDEAATIALIVCGRNLRHALQGYRLVLREGSKQIFDNELEKFAGDSRRRSEGMGKVIGLIRRELGVREPEREKRPE